MSVAWNKFIKVNMCCFVKFIKLFVFLLVYSKQLFWMMIFNFLFITFKDVAMIVHNITPMLLSYKVTNTLKLCQINKPAIFIESTTIITNGFTIWFGIKLLRILVSKYKRLSSIYLETNIKLTVCKENNFSYFLKFIINNSPCIFSSRF